jgi:hypothetical protein
MRTGRSEVGSPMIAARALGLPAAARARARGQQDQWLLQGFVQECAGGGDGQGEKPLHVGTAQPIQSIIAFRETQRVALPAALVKGYRIGVAGQYQPPRAAAQGRDQVGLDPVRGYLLDLGAKTHVGQPACQQVDYRPISLVP